MCHTRATLMYILLTLIMVGCVQSQCDITAPQDDCVILFKCFQQALINTSQHNLFHLQAVFFPPSRVTPTLVKVTYNLNVTCEPGFGEECVCNRVKEPYTLGWTHRELYKIFHPAVINLLSFQLPLWILQTMERTLTDNLDVDAFLWNGATDLPSVNVSLDVVFSPKNFTSYCPPNDDLIWKALGEVNLWVRFVGSLT